MDPPPSHSIASPQMPTALQMDIARWLFALEAFVHLLAIPVALCSLSLLLRTSVLHANLKFVLLSQTAAILLRSCLRLPAISVKFAVQNPFWSEAAFPPLQFGLLATVFFRNFLGHVILAERVLATIQVRNYEWERRFRWFSPLWALPLLLLAIWNGLDVKLPGQEQIGFFPLTSTINLATGQATLFCNIFEFIVLALLVRYNRHRFAETGQRQNVHNLSERYQLLENIRTTRQLLPILALHSLSNLNNSAIQLGQIFRLMPNSTAQFLVDTNTLGFFNASILTLAMLVATIISHPILRRNASLGLLRARNSCLGRKGSVGPTTTSLWPNGPPAGHQKTKEEYFKVLNKFWEQEFRRKAISI